MADKDYLVLARKYRPQQFDDLAGQEHVVQTLRSAISSGRIAHAFLFTGIRGVGKTTAARLLAKALNCERSDRPTPDPCGECSNCIEIRDSRSVDVAEIDGASNRGIDSIRELTENVRYLAIKSRFRVYIIDEAHMVTREGFNALLKTLEEPPPHVKFVFATTAVEKFPETIVSRCQRYDFKRISLARIQSELKRIAAEEGVAFTDTALFAIAREGQGSMRDAESLLERLIAFADQTVDDAKVGEVLGIADRRTLFATADAVLARDPKTAIEVLDRVFESGRDLERFSRDLLEHWRNLVVTQIGADGSVLIDTPADELAELRRQAALRERADVERLFRIARQGDEELSQSSLPRLVLEMTLVRMATMEPLVPIDAVLERLDDIERALGRPGTSGAKPAAPPAPRVERAATVPVASASTPSPAKTEAAPIRPPPVPARTTAAEAEAGPVKVAAVDGDDSRSRRPSPTPLPPGSATAGPDRWPDLLTFVQQKKLGLYLSLSHARFVGGGSGTLVLGVAKEKFRSELTSRPTLTQLESLVSEFYGMPTRVRVESVAEEATQRPDPGPTTTDMLDHPSVKAAVEILGGAVREVRSRR